MIQIKSTTWGPKARWVDLTVDLRHGLSPRERSQLNLGETIERRNGSFVTFFRVKPGTSGVAIYGSGQPTPECGEYDE